MSEFGGKLSFEKDVVGRNNGCMHVCNGNGNFDVPVDMHDESRCVKCALLSRRRVVLVSWKSIIAGMRGSLSCVRRRAGRLYFPYRQLQCWI